MHLCKIQMINCFQISTLPNYLPSSHSSKLFELPSKEFKTQIELKSQGMKKLTKTVSCEAGRCRPSIGRVEIKECAHCTCPSLNEESTRSAKGMLLQGDCCLLPYFP